MLIMEELYNYILYVVSYFLMYVILCLSDYDECMHNNGGCEGSCHNYVGSFQCDCPAGYALNPNNRFCDGECLK